MAAAATLEPGQAEMERRLYAGGAEAVCGEEGGVERQPPLGPPDAVATGAPATAYDEAPPASYLGPHGGVERWIVNKQGLKLKSHFWPAATKSARAVVLFCHGARAHGGCLPNARPPAPYLAHPPPPPHHHTHTHQATAHTCSLNCSRPPSWGSPCSTRGRGWSGGTRWG